MAKRRYPIGIQTFRDIIEGNYFYIDKTEFVYDLVENYRYVFLSRPRRFGKSLLMSTFDAYFKGEKDLFRGLAMEKLENDWLRYPVFRFDLSPANYNDLYKLTELLDYSLDRLAQVYSLSIVGPNCSVKFQSLIEQAYQKYGQKIVILIDEYDKPMLDCLDNPDLQEKFKAELRSFYSVIKSCDQYIRFAMLTGITKFGKISVFSGLNNLKDISLLPRYNAICGISETEFHNEFKEAIKSFAEENNISEGDAWSQFKTMYDGYHFASRGEGIYNPFSVINAFDDNEIKSFWYATGSPSFLVNLVQNNQYRLDEIEGQERTELQLSDITDISDDFVPLLFQSGYLTIKGYVQETQEYILGFPNKEVYKAFWDFLAAKFFRVKGGGSAFDVRKCLKDVYDGKPEDFMLRIKSLFADTSSEPEKDKEIHFQNMMAIVAKMMGLTVRTEVHSSAGRCDMQILTSRFVYIFEFKIDGTPEEAMAQIHEKGYATPYEADSRIIFLIGASFSTKTRTLDSWIIENMNWLNL